MHASFYQKQRVAEISYFESKTNQICWIIQIIYVSLILVRCTELSRNPF